MKNYKKTKNLQKTSKTPPERPGTPFKRRGMQIYVLFFRNYAFTTFWAPVFAKNIRKIIKQTCVCSAFVARTFAEKCPDSRFDASTGKSGTH